MASKITLDVISSQLEEVKKTVDQIELSLNGYNGTPGIKTRLDRLEQSEDSRKYHIRTIWSAFAAALIAWIFQFWYGHQQ